MFNPIGCVLRNVVQYGFCYQLFLKGFIYPCPIYVYFATYYVSQMSFQQPQLWFCHSLSWSSIHIMLQRCLLVKLGKCTSFILHSGLFLDFWWPKRCVDVPCCYWSRWVTCTNCVFTSVSWQDGEAALSNRCLRTAVWGRVGILGPGREPGGALLLDDVYPGNNYSHYNARPLGHDDYFLRRKKSFYMEACRVYPQKQVVLGGGASKMPI